MSFILDALRKSEHERQRKRAPGISDMRTAAKPQKRSIWLPLAALLAGLNIALLALLWYVGGDEPVAAPPEAPAVADAAPAATGNRDLAMELEPMDDPSRFASITPPSESPPPPAVAPADSGSKVARTPTVTEAILDGSLNVQPMRMDLHVYSDNPDERFVFINTTRYTEGERTSDGLIVSRISQEGAVLSYQGQDYLLTAD